MAADRQNDVLRGECLLNEPMARYTSWRVGGKADCFYTPADIRDLVLFLRQLPAHEPLTYLGLGSNVLIRDGGIRGTVVSMKNALTTLRIERQNQGELVVYAEAGVPCAQLARFAAKHETSGGEFFAGIPGTVGGALAMNAGAFGGETWRHVVDVETIDRSGEVRTRQPDEYQVGYRTVVTPPDEYFVAARFVFVKSSGLAGELKIKELLSKRSNTQPIGVYSCGSVFRNPDGDYAARLIESIGLKGKRLGGASVSIKHANFIVNEGQATANDIEQLIFFVQEQVEEKTGVLLHPEVRIIGEHLA